MTLGVDSPLAGSDLSLALAAKMKLNADKYPTDLARGTALKYSKLKR